MVNNLPVIFEVLNKGIPLTRDGMDLHRTIATDHKVDEWLHKHGDLKPVRLTVTKIDGRQHLDVLYYKSPDGLP